MLASVSPSPGRSHKMQKHGKKGEDTDQEQKDGHRYYRRLQTLLRHARDCGEASVPQVPNCPVVLPNRDYGRQHPATNQAKPQVVRHVWKMRLSAGRAAGMMKKQNSSGAGAHV